jgi:heparosan-N-sulfate-glucuronate 5-epimerase
LELSLWSVHETEENLAAATHIGQWLCGTQDADSGKWAYEFDYRLAGFKRGLQAPWPSAMAQGQAISLLTRLYRATGDNGYLAASRLACAPLEHDVREGGLRADLFGHPFYEEYPTDPPSFVLNGFIHALFGLYDLKVLGDDRAHQLLGDGMHTLIRFLPLYDARGMSAYDLGHITSPPRNVIAYLNYHRKHVALLRALYSVWPDDTIAFYASLWAGPLPEPIHRRLVRALIRRRSSRTIRSRLRH